MVIEKTSISVVVSALWDYLQHLLQSWIYLARLQLLQMLETRTQLALMDSFLDQLLCSLQEVLAPFSLFPTPLQLSLLLRSLR